MAKFKRILLKLSGESLMGEQGYGCRDGDGNNRIVGESVTATKSQTSGKYYVGKMVKGPAIMGCAGTNASVSLGVPTSNIDVCAFFSLPYNTPLLS